MYIDILEIWFGIASGKISSIFTELSARDTPLFLFLGYYGFTLDICFTLDISRLFVLMFYGPVNPMGSCRAWSVSLTTHLLGTLSPLSG